MVSFKLILDLSSLIIITEENKHFNGKYFLKTGGMMIDKLKIIFKVLGLKKFNQLQRTKSFYLWFFSWWLCACATTVYSPVHKLVEESLKPVKGGVVEYTALKDKVAISLPSFVIKDEKTAFKKAKIEAHKRIEKFCGNSGWTLIKTSKEMRPEGYVGHGVTYSYSTFTNIKPVYRKYKKITFKCGKS